MMIIITFCALDILILEFLTCKCQLVWNMLIKVIIIIIIKKTFKKILLLLLLLLMTILTILINNNTIILTIFTIHMTIQYLHKLQYYQYLLSLRSSEEQFKGEHIFPFALVIIYFCGIRRCWVSFQNIHGRVFIVLRTNKHSLRQWRSGN